MSRSRSGLVGGELHRLDRRRQPPGRAVQQDALAGLHAMDAPVPGRRRPQRSRRQHPRKRVAVRLERAEQRHDGALRARDDQLLVGKRVPECPRGDAVRGQLDALLVCPEQRETAVGQGRAWNVPVVGRLEQRADGDARALHAYGGVRIQQRGRDTAAAKDGRGSRADVVAGQLAIQSVAIRVEPIRLTWMTRYDEYCPNHVATSRGRHSDKRISWPRRPRATSSWLGSPHARRAFRRVRLRWLASLLAAYA